MEITEVVHCVGYGPEEDAAWSVGTGSDFLGQAQLIHLVNEEREIQKGFVTCPKI